MLSANREAHPRTQSAAANKRFWPGRAEDMISGDDCVLEEQFGDFRRHVQHTMMSPHQQERLKYSSFEGGEIFTTARQDPRSFQCPIWSAQSRLHPNGEKWFNTLLRLAITGILLQFTPKVGLPACLSAVSLPCFEITCAAHCKRQRSECVYSCTIPCCRLVSHARSITCKALVSTHTI